MLIRNLSTFVFIVFMLLISPASKGQKQVDMDMAEVSNDGLYKGNFFRAGIGLARASYNYRTVYEDIVVSPVNFNVELGKRMNRKFGAYFALSGNVVLNDVEVGLNDLLEKWAHGGTQLGGLYYIRGGSSYFAAELGMGIGLLETTNLVQRNTYGVGTALKYGYDRHIAANLFLGIQAFISFAHTWDPDQIDVQTTKQLTANSFVYGVNLNIKIGK